MLYEVITDLVEPQRLQHEALAGELLLQGLYQRRPACQRLGVAARGQYPDGNLFLRLFGLDTGRFRQRTQQRQQQRAQQAQVTALGTGAVV